MILNTTNKKGDLNIIEVNQFSKDCDSFSFRVNEQWSEDFKFEDFESVSLYYEKNCIFLK